MLLVVCTALADEVNFSKLLASKPEPGATQTTSLYSFAYIPAGEFKMGSPASEVGRGEDENQVGVTISSPFLMSTTEVTQGMWKDIMGTSIAELIETKKGAIGRGAKLVNKVSAEGPLHPMCYVSYEDALEFCAKLTEELMEVGVLSDGYKVTLPTEAQWEYASRAGTSNIFSSGDTFTEKDGCFYAPLPYGVEEKGIYLERTQEVKSYAPNAWGLYDMNGNMYEWCLDWYTEKLAGGKDPAEMVNGDSRNIRGGTWNRKGSSSRNAYRYSYDPTQRTNNIGFRVIIVGE